MLYLISSLFQNSFIIIKNM